MLGLLLAQALLSYDICLSGVMQALRLRFDQTSMLFAALCAVIVDAFFAVAQGRTPFCTVASLLLLLALWGRSLLYEARRRSLRAAGNMEEPVAAVREEKAWHGYDCIFRAPGDAAQFAVQLEMPDAGSRIMRVYAPVMTAVTLVLSILTAMRGGRSFLWSWTAMLLAGFPAGVLIAYAKPFSTFAKKLYRVGATPGAYSLMTLPPRSMISRISGRFSGGYGLSPPPPSTATVRPPASSAPRCAQASMPSAMPETTHMPASASAIWARKASC